MKLTKSKMTWVINRVNHYCKLLEITPPEVFLTMAEYNQWKVQKREESGYSRVGRSTCLGVCHRQDKFIVILIKRARDLVRLDDTIRHELIHYAKPSYNHYSLAFRDRMNKLLKGKIKNGRF
ncbi:hypothetical protein LCGC14_1763890 [marine sediment metagenome]|uniref:SprT-like domain-containing protein n=1 Tax=marine sediment metagenome TaxID=412755 RepID=A0A0F9JF76_9ZZZZ